MFLKYGGILRLGIKLTRFQNPAWGCGRKLKKKSEWSERMWERTQELEKRLEASGWFFNAEEGNT